MYESEKSFYKSWGKEIPTKLEQVGSDLSNTDEVMRSIKQASPEELLAESRKLQKGVD